MVEWQFWMKRGYPSFIRDHLKMDLIGFMETMVEEEKYSEYPILRDLCTVGLSLAVSNAVVEDSFSAMAIVKDSHSNGLDDTPVDDRLQIKLNGPPEMPVCISFVGGLLFFVFI